MREGWYDTAQICLSGHVINSAVKASPEHSAKFCKVCGESTFTTCAVCKTEIRGKHFMKGVWDLSARIALPRFCEVCGNPYPWTQAKMKAAQDLVSVVDNLSEEERNELRNSVDDIVKDTPQTTIAATRFKKLIKKADKGAAEGFKNILTDIISEAAKKMIWPTG